MDLRFKDKSVLITGAGNGLGRATALAFAREGARLTLLDIDAAALANSAAGIGALGGEEPLQLCLDLSRREACRLAVEECLAHFGRLDVLCNIAGIVRMGPLEDVSEDDWLQLVNINLAAPLWLSQAALPHLAESGGNIVNCGSQSALKGSAFVVPYSMTKAGIAMMTKSMAMEYMHKNVRINAVCPGTMKDTRMTEGMTLPENIDPALFSRFAGLRPPAAPDDVAAMFLYLASDAARAVHGAIVSVDGGTTAD